MPRHARSQIGDESLAEQTAAAASRGLLVGISTCTLCRRGGGGGQSAVVRPSPLPVAAALTRARARCMRLRAALGASPPAKKAARTRRRADALAPNRSLTPRSRSTVRGDRRRRRRVTTSSSPRARREFDWRRRLSVLLGTCGARSGTVRACAPPPPPLARRARCHGGRRRTSAHAARADVTSFQKGRPSSSSASRGSCRPFRLTDGIGRHLLRRPRRRPRRHCRSPCVAPTTPCAPAAKSP